MEVTPIQALALLENATAQLQLTREDHVRIQVAVETLKGFIEDNTSVEETDVPDEK